MEKLTDRVGVLGLGRLGQAISRSLVAVQTCSVVGYDKDKHNQESFAAIGGKREESPQDVAKNIDYLICSAGDLSEIDDLLFNIHTGAAKELPTAAVVLICSSVSPDYHESLRTQMDEAGRSDVFILDCPVSISAMRIGESLTIFASGSPEALEKGKTIIKSIASNVHHIKGGCGVASKMNLVHLQLNGIHNATAAEAVSLASTAGLNVQEVYNIIVGPAAGDSRAFENQVPRMIEADWTPRSTTVDEVVKDMSLVTAAAKSLQFPLPISSIVEQLYILASTRGYGKESDAGIMRVSTPKVSRFTADSLPGAGDNHSQGQVVDPKPISRIGFVGLGAMGYGMATSLVRAGYLVTAFDVYKPSVDKFVAACGNARGATTAAEAFSGAEFIILMVQNAAQVEAILFGAEPASDSIPDGAAIMLNSTVPSSYARELALKLTALGRGISLVDAPVSGGAARAASGDLTFICSGDEKVISVIHKPLLAMAGTSKNICRVHGGAGAASSVKMINQLLAGVHITAAAEAMAFSTRLGLDPSVVFDIIKKEASWSWMFENRVPQILSQDWTPFSALAIFVKDMGIVTDEARRLGAFAPISSVAHTLYLEGAAKGLTKEADVGVFRLWPLPVECS